MTGSASAASRTPHHLSCADPVVQPNLDILTMEESPLSFKHPWRPAPRGRGQESFTNPKFSVHFVAGAVNRHFLKPS
jgi:hypothetical protein